MNELQQRIMRKLAALWMTSRGMSATGLAAALGVKRFKAEATADGLLMLGYLQWSPAGSYQLSYAGWEWIKENGEMGA